MTKHRRVASIKTGGLSKVIFELEESDWHEHATETLWAIPLETNQHRIQNVPFYVRGVSYDDVVSTREVDGQNLFDSVLQRGGHSTYRIFLPEDIPEAEFDRYWAPLKALGCTYERATDYLLAVDVPPQADIYEAYKALQQGLAADIWDFEEGHCGHPLRN